jgi:isopenicillin N synthase-like dioxygenase
MRIAGDSVHSERVIPVLDLASVLAGRPRALEAAAAEMRSALESIGFFVLVDHGVPQSLIDRTFGEARRFHALPLDAKLAVRMNEHNNGYMAMERYTVRTSDVNTNDTPDLNEAFFVRRERSPDDPLVREVRRFAGPNVWPRDLPGFREIVLEYIRAMDALSVRMVSICARALDLPSDYFDAAFADSQFTFRLTHYPATPPRANQYGLAPHTDANFLTFLAQSDVPGLQVRTPSNEWLDVPYVPGSFAVNAGDMMVRWTNGRFKSTPHRALPPVGRDRYAIPFFLGPHLDTVIECLPTCLSADEAPKFPPITYGAYLDWWYDANYSVALQQDVV